jgi:hypothetical protein
MKDIMKDGRLWLLLKDKWMDERDNYNHRRSQTNIKNKL